MNRDAILKLCWLPVVAMACFCGSTIAGAQQASGAYGAASASAAGASHTPGFYSADSTVQIGVSAFGLASQRGSESQNRANAGSATATQAWKINSRSLWMAGSNSMEQSNAPRWTAGEESFGGRGAASWIAGKSKFSSGRQEGGIWLLTPASGAQLNVSAEANDLSAPAGLTSKGAAILRGAGLSSRFALHQAGGFSSRGTVGGHLGARPISGGINHPFAAHAPASGNPGTRFGSNSLQQLPSSGNPALH